MFFLGRHVPQLCRRTFNPTKVQSATGSSKLKSIISELIPKEQEKIKSFRKSHGQQVIGNITVDSIYTGMRGLRVLLCETSVLDPQEGIRVRGYTLADCIKLLPKAKGGEQPLPEGIFWLLLTGAIPTEDEVDTISGEWARRAAVPNHVESLVKNIPLDLHPMTKFVIAINALNSESQFTRAYAKGVKKNLHWEYVYEDAMDLIAKVTVVAANIYRYTYDKKKAEGLGIIDEKKDWSANFVNMMGFENPKFTELMRLYLTIHCDHEGGNVSAHTVRLVGSALSDPYLAFAAGMSGLAGPLHGLANQETMLFMNKILKELGNSPTESQLKDFINNILDSGQVVPGFGHAVLKVTDPRYMFLREFSLKHLPKDPMFKLCNNLFKIVPDILKARGKVQNPWPNVDAQSGVVLQHFDLKEIQFYTVLFGVSRALGTLASLIWDRALGIPIERPKSISTDLLIKEFSATKVS